MLLEKFGTSFLGEKLTKYEGETLGRKVFVPSALSRQSGFVIYPQK